MNAADVEAVEDDLNPFAPAPGQTRFKPSGMVCMRCDRDTVIASGEEIYPGREDLRDKSFWLCRPCWLYVGCHAPVKHVDAKGRETWSGGAVPLGTVADEALRALRSRAHGLFDPLWKDGTKTRAEAYAWLAELLDLEPRAAHIAMLSTEQCTRLIDELQAAQPRPAAPSIDTATEMLLARRFNRSVRGLHGLAIQLHEAGVQFQVKNNGHHVIVHAKHETFDVWPSTQRWIARSNGERHEGLGGLMRAASQAS